MSEGQVPEIGPEPIELSAPRWKTGLVVATGVPFVVLFAGLALAGSEAGLVVVIVGVAGIALFVPMMLYGLHRMVSHRPLLRLDARGLTDRASTLAVGFLPWEQIRSVEVGRLYNQRGVAIHLADPEPVKSRLSAMKRWSMGCNQPWYGCDLMVPWTALPLSAAAAAALIDGWRRQYGGPD